MAMSARNAPNLQQTPPPGSIRGGGAGVEDAHGGRIFDVSCTNTETRSVVPGFTH